MAFADWHVCLTITRQKRLRTKVHSFSCIKSFASNYTCIKLKSLANDFFLWFHDRTFHSAIPNKLKTIHCIEFIPFVLHNQMLFKLLSFSRSLFGICFMHVFFEKMIRFIFNEGHVHRYHSTVAGIVVDVQHISMFVSGIDRRTITKAKDVIHCCKDGQTYVFDVSHVRLHFIRTRKGGLPSINQCWH